MEGELKYRYWLKSIPGIGNKKQKKLVEYCGSAREVYHLSQRGLESVRGLKERDISAIMDSRQSWQLEREAEFLEKEQIFLISMEEKDFPEKLVQISDGPYAFFYKGKLPGTQGTAAIVGTRQCSSYGKSMALNLAESLASCGIQIISGMAAGIDSFGHWGAIHAGGSTFAVLGCGVNVCYPKGAFELYERILENGGIISEYMPGTPPAPGLFPLRNRIISALSDYVIVVEARKRSGSLITADYALEQGKDIYAVPGRVDDALSQGCNQLISQGAGIILSPQELLSDLNLCWKKDGRGREDKKNTLEKDELLVYSCLDLHAITMEELTYRTGLKAERAADLVIRLILRGLVEETFKNHYRKI